MQSQRSFLNLPKTCYSDSALFRTPRLDSNSSFLQVATNTLSYLPGIKDKFKRSYTLVGGPRPLYSLAPVERLHSSTTFWPRRDDRETPGSGRWCRDRPCGSIAKFLTRLRAAATSRAESKDLMLSFELLRFSASPVPVYSTVDMSGALSMRRAWLPNGEMRLDCCE
jgi:hypothetical protein